MLKVDNIISLWSFVTSNIQNKHRQNHHTRALPGLAFVSSFFSNQNGMKHNPKENQLNPSSNFA